MATFPANLASGDRHTDQGIIYEIVDVTNAATAQYTVKIIGATTVVTMTYAELLHETEAEWVRVVDPTRPNDEGMWVRHDSTVGSEVNYLKQLHTDIVVAA